VGSNPAKRTITYKNLLPQVGETSPPVLLQPTGGLKEVSARPLVRIGHFRADGPPAFCHSPHPGLLLAQMLHHESHTEVPHEYLGSALDSVVG
jgi:hypothetical protein